MVRTYKLCYIKPALKFMNKRSIASFLALGIVSIVAQVVIQREFVNGFYGNELFIGVVMASWLAWTAAGSLLAPRFCDKLQGISSSVGLVFILEIFFIRLLKGYVGLPGEIPNIMYATAVALLIPAPVCLLLGMWWRAGTKSCPAKVSEAYLVETAGFILGGAVFSFFLVGLQEFSVAVFLFILISALCTKTYNLTTFIKIAIAVALMFLPLLPRLDLITMSYRYEGQKLVETKNTLYGNIAVTKLGEQYNFFENSVPFGSTEKVQFDEDLAHFSLLQSSSSKRVLLLGGGSTGVINEILKHPVERLDYVELDPELIRISEKYVRISDPRLNTVFTDGRYFLKNTREKYDVIIINLPPPATALLNRYYTKEFFETAGSRLEPNGIFINCLPYSPSTPNRRLGELSASIFKTLREVFSNTIVLPDETIFFISSSSGAVTYDAQILIQRFEERKIKTDYFIRDYITYRMTTDRIGQALASFENNKTAKINRDLFPISFFYQNLLWLDLFYPKLAQILETFTGSFGVFFAAALLLLIVLFYNKPVLLSMGAAGFSLMSLEMAVIFLYQIFVGYLYYRIALLISALMLGMVFGVLIGKRSRSFYKFHSAIILFCCVLPFILNYLVSETMIILFAVISGFLCAAVFPIANRLYASKNTGTIYSADLIGSCFGALLPSLILIPAFGIYRTLSFVALANLAVMFLLFLKHLRRGA